MEEIQLSDILEGVIAKGAGSTSLSFGKRHRGPIATADFIYECMVGVALELTDRLPQMFEYERQKYEQHKKLLTMYGNKGKYTDSYGWSRNGEFKMEFSFSQSFHHYFNRIIVPFLGGKKKGWHDENSKIWKYVKKLIISGDTHKITNLQASIRNTILKESRKKIIGVQVNGTNDTEAKPSVSAETADI